MNVNKGAGISHIVVTLNDWQIQTQGRCYLVPSGPVSFSKSVHLVMRGDPVPSGQLQSASVSDSPVTFTSVLSKT